MGQSMAGHILAAGFNVRVYNRTKQKADALVSGGDLEARNASLSIMVGGEPEDFQRAMAIFQSDGNKYCTRG